MSYEVFDEHLAYWSDAVKIDRYRRALAEVIRPGSIVLDLGSGTGLLGLLACEAGAAKVYAVDSGPIASVAATMFERNGMADRVEVVRANSVDVTLPERVDVIVGDQIGGFGYSAGVFASYSDAVARLLQPDGATIPTRIEFLLAPVEHAPARDAVEPFTRTIAGFDLSAIHERVQNNIRVVHLRDPSSLLADPAVVHAQSVADARRLEVRVRQEIRRDGVLDGIAGMFVATMTPRVRMSNVPGHPDKMERRWQDLFPVGRSLPVHRGDVVSTHIVANPRTYLGVWSVVVERAGVTILDERHSTFEGQLLDPLELRVLDGRPVPLSALGRAAVAAIARTGDGELDVGRLTATLADALPHVSASEIDRLVGRLARALVAGTAD